MQNKNPALQGTGLFSPTRGTTLAAARPYLFGDSRKLTTQAAW